MPGKTKQNDKRNNGEQSERRGSAAADPRKHDPGRMTGNQPDNREYDARRERRREDEQQEVNEEAI